MDVRVLGPISVVVDGEERSIGGARQRRLLAALVLAAGRGVTADRLVDAVWGDEPEPPDGAVRTVQSYVSRLRSALGEERVVPRDGGYALDPGTVALDVDRFRALVADARQAPPAEARRLLDAALAEWRGPAFGGFADEAWARPAAAHLEELRLVALELRVQALIDTGAHTEAVPELEELARTHPLRERFRSQLMVALHRGGRQAEALRAYQDHRRLLADHTGLEPSRDLADLERRIALDDPSLAFVAAGRTTRGYVLTEVIGEGAFGTVYRAVQPSVGREVAVKVVRAELADDPDYIRRFEGEARLVARLEHPHIVPLYDFWREPGGAYLVFRYLRGGTLEQRGAVEGAWSLEQADRLVREIGSALAVAHATGVVHRDVKPANVLFDDDGSAFLADFGIALAGADGDAGPLRSAGSPLYAAPEQIRDGEATARSDQYALAVLTWELLAGVVPFEAVTVASLLQVKLARTLGPLAHRPDVPDAVAAVLQRAAAVHPDDRFATMADFLAAWRAALARPAAALVTTGRSPAEGAGPSLTSTLAGLGLPVVNPYQGLRPFDEGDAARFRGRAADSLALAAAIEEHRLVAVVGPSGSGKSSLVRAGAGPLLRQRGHLVAAMVPGDRPADELAEALSRVAVEAPPSPLGGALAAGGLGALLDAVLPAGADLVLVVDQAEELWTLTDREGREPFVDALVRAVTAPGSRLRVVLTVRADFYDRPLGDARLGPLVSDATFALTALSAADLDAAIVGPAEALGVRVEPSLVAALVGDVVAQPAGLPLLQYTLTELFDRRDGATMTRAAYDAMGGLAGALSRRADDTYDGFDDDGRAAARRLFSRLVAAGDGTEDTRRRARRSELAAVPAGVVDAFGAARLLTFDVDPGDREPTVEVAHEALIRHWPRLRAWLAEDRDALRTLNHVADAARAWHARGRDEGDLYRGARLSAVRELPTDVAAQLAPLERDFVAASSDRAEADERRRRRQTRRLRGLAAAVSVALVGVLVVSGLAVRQRDTARRAADQAASSRDEASDARKASDVRRLAFESQLVASTSPDLAALLAAEAFRLSGQTAEAYGALLTALTARPNEVAYIDPGLATEDVVRGGVRVGATRLAVATGDRVAVVDLASGPRPPVVWAAGAGASLAASPDGSEIATVTDDGLLRWWSAYDGSPRPALSVAVAGRQPGGTTPLAYVGGESVAVADGDAVRVVDRTGHERRTIDLGARPVALALDTQARRLLVLLDDALVAIDPGDGRVAARTAVDGGRRLALDAARRILWVEARSAPLPLVRSGATPTIAGIDLDTFAVAHAPVALPTPVQSVATRPGGGVVVGHERGGVRLVAPDGAVGEALAAPSGDVLGVLDDGRVVVAGGRGTLVVLDPDASSAIGETLPLRGIPVVSLDGSRMLVGRDGQWRQHDGITFAPIDTPLRSDLADQRGPAALSTNGALAVVTTATRPGQGQLIDTATGRPVSAPFPVGATSPDAPTFSPDGHLLAVPGTGTIEVLDVPSAQLRATIALPAGTTSLSEITWSPDSTRIASFTAPAPAPAHDAATGEPLGPPLGEPGGCNQRWQADSASVAVECPMHDLRVVDAVTGDERTRFPGQVGLGGSGFEALLVYYVRLSRGSWALDLLSTARRSRVGYSASLARDDNGSAVVPDRLGRLFVAQSADAPIRVFYMFVGVWLDRVCSFAGRNLTQTEWDQYLGSLGVPYHRTCPENPPAPGTTS